MEIRKMEFFPYLVLRSIRYRLVDVVDFLLGAEEATKRRTDALARQGRDAEYI